MTLRILVTGSRDWDNLFKIEEALLDALTLSTIGLPVLVHGGNRTWVPETRSYKGADWLADMAWMDWEHARPGTLATPERYFAKDFPTPLVRNQHMVDLGATVCLAFAKSWASGTGHCARAARRAGIPVRDYGVPTASRTAS